MTPTLIDTTLRDGEQAPGVSFSPSDKRNIAISLDALGIQEAELGTPAMGAEEIATIRSITTLGLKMRTSCWCRALKKDIDLALQCKTDSINISFPVSDIQLSAIGKNRKWVMNELPQMVHYAAERFETVTVGAQDASRSDTTFLKEYIDTCQSYGANRVRIADTVGKMTPIDVQNMFSHLRKAFPDMDLEFHPHNDLGMATANAFIALSAGATSISGTITGLGERSGNCALEELIVTLHLQEPTTYDTRLIQEIGQLVSQTSKRTIPTSKAILGEMAFAHESGIHVRSILKDKMSYQAFDESLVGADNAFKIVRGKHNGRAAAEYLRRKRSAEPSSSCMFHSFHQSTNI